MPLYLHFDINYTCVPFDTTSKLKYEETTNELISKHTYGKLVFDQWVINKDPYDEIDSISYYEYCKKTNTKEKSYKFTEEKEPGHIFRHVYDEIVDKKFFYVFQSFLEVLKGYEDAKLIFRTFGPDGDLVINMLQNRYGVKKQFTKCYLHYIEGRWEMQVGREVMHNFDEINDFIVNCPTDLLIIDDYQYWDSHERKPEYGKQICGMLMNVQLNFDDNDCVNLMRTMNCRKFKINSIRAATEKDYFTGLIKQSIRIVPKSKDK